MSPEDVTGYRQASRMDFEGEADDDEDDYMSEADISDDATADVGPPGSASPEKRPRLEYDVRIAFIVAYSIASLC